MYSKNGEREKAKGNIKKLTIIQENLTNREHVYQVKQEQQSQNERIKKKRVNENEKTFENNRMKKKMNKNKK